MIYFVGAGPGAADLITVRGQRYLEQADVIIYTGSLVNPKLLEAAKPDCKIYNSAYMTLEEVLAVMEEAAGRDCTTVRLHTGDSSLYGAVREQMDALREREIAFEVCPGVSSLFGAAASLQIEYTLPDVSQTLIITREEGRTPVPEKEGIAQLASHQSTMVLFLSASLAKKVQEDLLAGGYQPDVPVAVVYKATWPDEKILHTCVGNLAEVMEASGIDKTALIIVGEILGEVYAKSKLYDASFSTGYRKGSMVESTKVLMVACSRQGHEQMKRLDAEWKAGQDEITTICLTKCRSLPEISIQENLSDCIGKYFKNVDAIVFFCAVGIAVRLIAPYLHHKSADPAVVVMDDTGKFCIPILSGHMGGANELAEKIAASFGTVSVITTATDRANKFSVDDFARKNKLTVSSWEIAKQIAAEILEGKYIRMDSEYPVAGECPEEVLLSERLTGEGRICISPHVLTGTGREQVLQLIPKWYVIGIGCRKGILKEQIETAVETFLDEERILPETVDAIASIDLKKEEAGLIAYCREKDLPFLTYPARVLQMAEGVFSESEFVEQVTGVSCVCERSAVTAAQGALLCRKRVYDGVTVALAAKKRSITF